MATTPPGPRIEFSSGGMPAVTTEMATRHVVYHPVSAQELDMVAALGNSIHLAFFGISIGALIAFWITVKTVTLGADDRNLFWILMLAAGFLSPYFLALSIREVVRSRRMLSDIKRRPTVA